MRLRGLLEIQSIKNVCDQKNNDNNLKKFKITKIYIILRHYIMGGQPPARGPDPVHEGLASGPLPYSAITLQSGPRNPRQKNAGFISVMYAQTANMFASFANRDANYGDRYYAANQKYIKKKKKQFQALVDMQYGDLLYFCEVPVCVTCRRRSPSFFVTRIFPTLISSSTRDGSLA